MLRFVDKNPIKSGGGQPDPHNPNPNEPVHTPPDVMPAPPDLPPLPDFDPFPTPAVTPR